jgi:hypothetical protein
MVLDSPIQIFYLSGQPIEKQRDNRSSGPRTVCGFEETFKLDFFTKRAGVDRRDGGPVTILSANARSLPP